MRRVLILLLLLPIFLCADWDTLFSEQEDPSNFQHVNVITGHLNLSLHDEVVQGAVPIPISRTYSSVGALERSPQMTDLFLKTLRGGWMVQGGWSLFSHTNLFIEFSPKRKQYKAYVAEPNGSTISYSYSHKQRGTAHIIFLKPDRSINRAFGRLSARTNPQNNLLRMDLQTGEALLILPDGGSRLYRGRILYPYPQKTCWKCYYHLEEEALPNRHIFRYSYDKEGNLRKVESKSPSGEKTYASINIDLEAGDKNKPLEIKIRTSDAKNLKYKSIRHEHREYLSELEHNLRPHEKEQLVPGRKGIGARLSTIDIAGEKKFRVSYHNPDTLDQQREWAKKPDRKQFHIDKVEAIFEPVGPNGEEVEVAHFNYYPDHTDVLDAKKALTRFHHDGERLLQIEYFDLKGRLHSCQKFYWDGSLLACKALLDPSSQPIFAKTFSYRDGNVVEEVLWGNLTGEIKSPLHIDEKGKPAGAENCKRTYTYYNQTNLLKTEAEEGGLTTEYHYVNDTDLLRAKFIKDEKGKIIIRELRYYNADNLLISEAIDNGNSIDPTDFSNITQRTEKKYELHPVTGLPVSASEWYWDPEAEKTVLLKKVQFTYENQKISKEEIFDTEGVFRCAIETTYDEFGQIKTKTSPLGQVNTYRRNAQGQLEEIKEVGSSKKIYHYDKGGRQTSCLDLETKKATLSTYDEKGRVLSQTDPNGNTTTHTYDSFGNRLTTTLPKCKDDTSLLYEPRFTYEYDTQGNLISTTTSRRNKTLVSYTLLRKPILVTQADGTQLRHSYNKNGTLSKVILPDLTEVHFEYDVLQRMTSKDTYTKEKKKLSHETWKYNSFQLLSHTDPLGLTTYFTYDGSGRKIKETALEQTTTYTYDSMGFLEKIDRGFSALIQKRNLTGLIEEQWEEDSTGRIHNKTHFFYDVENRKEKAIRLTSQGEATDLFEYHHGKLSLHTDPVHAITQFIYNEEFTNDFQQKVLQKTTIDPLHLKTVETFDVGGKLVALEKQDAQGRTSSKEELLYDQSGNKVKQITHVFVDHQVVRISTISWVYNAMGQLEQQIEPQNKIISYKYDSRGRVKLKTLPSGISLEHTYDSLDRLTELKSSDGMIHLEHQYAQGLDPVKSIDHITGRILQRTYNPFGQLTSETSSLGLTLSWDYDSNGRCKLFTLPDNSAVHYSYSGAHLASVQRLASDATLLYEHHYTEFDPNGHVTTEDPIFNLGPIHTTHNLLERPSTHISPWLQQSVSYGLSGLIETKQDTLFGQKTYHYDSLNQLISEGDTHYQFDSLGNPTNYQTNELNQILQGPDFSLDYDLNGNPQHRLSSTQSITYQYDALNRLTQISYPTKKIIYTYDPLNRLSTKQILISTSDTWQQESSLLYLYDQQKEVGTCTPQGQLLQFKTLGLGLKEDIGAAIAIEIQGNTYLPLHDLGGNIIALISSQGHLIEQYNIDAFGKEPLSPSMNPWHYCSKRTEEGLIFFGLRFYDPSLGRWLTPDLAGFADGPNLYLYVLNSPLNRLDLFGLFSQDPFAVPKINIYVPLSQIPTLNGLEGFLCKGAINGSVVDFYVFCHQLHELSFFPEEVNSGSLDLALHLHEIIPRHSDKIVATSFGNGIANSLEDFKQSNNEVLQTIRKYSGLQHFMLSIYNPTEGRFVDVHRVNAERNGVETKNIIQVRQFVHWFGHELHKINPVAKWFYIPHSEHGLLLEKGIDKLPSEIQSILRKQLFIYAVGSAESIPLHRGFSVMNIYSTGDFITGFGVCGVANKYKDNPDYDVQILKSCASYGDICTGRDHEFLRITYQKSWDGVIYNFNQEVGFYGK